MSLNAVALGVADITRGTAFYEALSWSRSPMSTSAMAVLTSDASVALILYTVEDLAADANVPSDGIGFRNIALVVAVRSPEESTTPWRLPLAQVRASSVRSPNSGSDHTPTSQTTTGTSGRWSNNRAFWWTRWASSPLP